MSIKEMNLNCWQLAIMQAALYDDMKRISNRMSRTKDKAKIEFLDLQLSERDELRDIVKAAFLKQAQTEYKPIKQK